MSEIAIRAEGLSKRYRIGSAEESHETLIGGLLSLASRPARNLRNLSRLSNFKVDEDDADDVIWALRDVSFDVKEGEVVGIIGRNGAGKSTLLKILTRITLPTRGRVTIRGSVQSLLEVGTGFHKELTGRENVYLNGAVLGMPAREITRKFDEIVDFSGVEKFIDTPVKRYSTGMRVRLAFSVAAHLEPEVLLVDEVLSVGDEEFQRRCLGKMDEVAGRGRTVLFVSHNLQSVTRLCQRVLLMGGGRILMDAPAHEAVGEYLSGGERGTAVREWDDPKTAPGGEVARLRAVRIVNEKGEASDAIDTREGFRIEMEYEVMRPGHALRTNFTVWNHEEGVPAFSVFDLDKEWRARRRPEGRYRTSAWVPGNLLGDGMFTVNVALAVPDSGVLQFHETGAVAFHVVDPLDGETSRGDWVGKIRGVVRPKLDWTTEYEPSVPAGSSTLSEEVTR
ncbi:MAG: ABC transporter ATP-binding protein [Thioalkalivibrio sp.]|nr:ABC transporter ATP-binding protein [Thioalkalivibrio sp.]